MLNNFFMGIFFPQSKGGQHLIMKELRECLLILLERRGFLRERR
jgi:hypothetical protein